jgi:hypothetical protein
MMPRKLTVVNHDSPGAVQERSAEGPRRRRKPERNTDRHRAIAIAGYQAMEWCAMGLSDRGSTAFVELLPAIADPDVSNCSFAAPKLNLPCRQHG